MISLTKSGSLYFYGQDRFQTHGHDYAFNDGGSFYYVSLTAVKTSRAVSQEFPQFLIDSTTLAHCTSTQYFVSFQHFYSTLQTTCDWRISFSYLKCLSLVNGKWKRFPAPFQHDTQSSIQHIHTPMAGINLEFSVLPKDTSLPHADSWSQTFDH